MGSHWVLFSGFLGKSSLDSLHHTTKTVAMKMNTVFPLPHRRRRLIVRPVGAWRMSFQGPFFFSWCYHSGWLRILWKPPGAPLPGGGRRPLGGATRIPPGHSAAAADASDVCHWRGRWTHLQRSLEVSLGNWRKTSHPILNVTVARFDLTRIAMTLVRIDITKADLSLPRNWPNPL